MVTINIAKRCVVYPPHNDTATKRTACPDLRMMTVYFAPYTDISFVHQVSAAVGTPAFLAPEIARGGKARGKPSDVWSLGVTLFYIVCGQLPFLGETVAHVIKVGLWW
jgi:serine/threonine protein kinase